MPHITHTPVQWTSLWGMQFCMHGLSKFIMLKNALLWPAGATWANSCFQSFISQTRNGTHAELFWNILILMSLTIAASYSHKVQWWNPHWGRLKWQPKFTGLGHSWLTQQKPQASLFKESKHNTKDYNLVSTFMFKCYSHNHYNLHTTKHAMSTSIFLLLIVFGSKCFCWKQRSLP